MLETREYSEGMHLNTIPFHIPLPASTCHMIPISCHFMPFHAISCHACRAITFFHVPIYSESFGYKSLIFYVLYYAHVMSPFNNICLYMFSCFQKALFFSVNSSFYYSDRESFRIYNFGDIMRPRHKSPSSVLFS